MLKSMKIELQGAEDFKALLNKLPLEAQNEIVESMRTIGEEIRTELKSNLSIKGTRPPGGFPGMKSGDLRRSIGFIISRPQWGKPRMLLVGVRNIALSGKRKAKGWKMFYSHMLEYGTSRSAPRPFLFSTVNKYSGKFSSAFSNALGKVIRRYNGGAA